MRKSSLDKYIALGLTKDELQALFCEQSLTMPEIGRMFNISSDVVYSLIHEYDIVRTPEQEAKYKSKMSKVYSDAGRRESTQSKKRENAQKKYGTDCWHRSEEGKKTLREIQQREDVRNKSKQTCLNNFGSETFFGSDAFKEHADEYRTKARETSKELFGTEYWSQSEQGKLFLREHHDEQHEKAVQTCVKRYGVEDPNQLQEIKDKIIKTKIERFGEDYMQMFDEKARATKLERYGDENYNNVEKAKQTKLEKYGNKNFVNVEKSFETRALKHGSVEASYAHGVGVAKQHLKELHGDDLSDYYSDIISRGWLTRDRIHGNRENAVQHQFQNAAENMGFDTVEEYFEWWSEQRMNTERLKYNVRNHYPNVEKYRQTVINNWGSFEAMKQAATIKYNETMMSRYGVMNTFQLPHVRGSYSAHSKVNIAFGTLLNSWGIDYEEEFPLESRLYDFKIGNILVEIDPTATHNSTLNIFSKTAEAMPTDYHLKKSQLAADNDYRCIHVWDWDDWNKIVTLLLPKKTIGARLCEVKDLSNDLNTVKDFITNNHLQGQCQGTSYALGLFYNDELVQVMTFGKPRYNKKYEYELLRLCSCPEYRVAGGASRLFQQFIKLYSPSSIISYCDNAKFDGDVYTNMSMTLVTRGAPTKHWASMNDSSMHITDNLLRQRGFDQLFGSKFGFYGKGTSNEELMLKHKFVTVYDCGQSVYEWQS